VSTPLEVLIIDDSLDRGELALGELRRAGYALRAQRVQTTEALLECLGEQSWQLLLCSHSSPGFDVAAVVALAHQRAPELPIVVLSGRIGEERAADCLRAGARDLVLEDHFARLVLIVERELLATRQKDDQRRTNEQLRRAEAQLGRTEKLRLLGHMAGRISHDLKNLLNPLSLYLDLADRALARGDVERARFGIGELKQVIQLGVQTVDRLRVFSSPASELTFSKLDLDAIAREAVVLSEWRMSEAGHPGVRIETQLTGPLEVNGEHADLLSAVLNLLANSIDALPNGGTIRVRTGKDQDQPWLEVSDDGPGMAPEIRDKVFEPFFGTKTEPGAGLGLAMVQSAMLRHDARISVSSEPGQGTTLRLSFSRA